MKAVVARVAHLLPLTLEDIDVSTSGEASEAGGRNLPYLPTSPSR
jgi:hypothetical protein